MKIIPIILISLFSILSSINGQKQLRVMIYNLRFGELATMQQMGEFIKSFEPDIVLLQEVDVYCNRPITPHQNGVNFIAELGFYTNMNSIFSKSIPYQGGYYGLGVLSKFPIASMQKYNLPMVEAKREQRCLLLVEIELDENQSIIVGSTHLDLKSSIRIKQIEEINSIVQTKNLPILIGGDFNARPTSEEISIGMKDWGRLCSDDYTIPANGPKSKIDYLFCKPKHAWRKIESDVPMSNLSDHLPIISVIELQTK